jgi:hypothetical protein
MTPFGRRIRFRGTSITGFIQRRIIHNGERLFVVMWDHDGEDDPQPYRAHDLEATERTERMNQDKIPRLWAWDRKEGFSIGETVEDREQFRSNEFKRI